MSAFLRFTLLVAALCAAVVVGYLAGVRKSEPAAAPGDRMTIDTRGTSGGAGDEPEAPPPPAAQPRAADAAAQDAGGQNASEPSAPTSIDEILRKQSAQEQRAE